ncbi:MAG: hypothetical protein IT429_10955 [Gemmataceae bacterium]|nr:hypothetical protein [Gemmataceae bacterium]
MSDIPNPDAPVELGPRCIHLSCRSMLIYGEDFEQDPEYQAGMAEWTCTCTCTPAGPDGGMAALEYCRNPERPCYREY